MARNNNMKRRKPEFPKMKVGIYILAGGSGKRLWPITRKNRPKWSLAPCGDGEMLIEKVYKLAQKIISNYEGDIIICLDEKSRIASFGTLNKLEKVEFYSDDILSQNWRPKDTATAIESAILCSKQGNAMRQLPQDDIAVFLPSDFIVENDDEFVRAVCECIGHVYVEKALGSDEKRLHVLGAKPTYPNVDYGYISRAGKFHEKPSESIAYEYFHDGGYYWNMGILVCDPAYLYKKLQAIPWDEKYEKSIDYVILEKEEKVWVEPCDCGWDDLGSLDRYLKVIGTSNVYSPLTARRIIDLTATSPYIIDMGDITVVVDKQNLSKLKDFYETQLEDFYK